MPAFHWTDRNGPEEYIQDVLTKNTRTCVEGLSNHQVKEDFEQTVFVEVTELEYALCKGEDERNTRKHPVSTGGISEARFHSGRKRMRMTYPVHVNRKITHHTCMLALWNGAHEEECMGEPARQVKLIR